MRMSTDWQHDADRITLPSSSDRCSRLSVLKAVVLVLAQCYTVTMQYKYNLTAGSMYLLSVTVIQVMHLGRAFSDLGFPTVFN